ncbi:TonB-dependent receptor [Pedobacter sp. G11]|uniref:TonB-dependent receptor n=1 Tax=Pedobacter sp. G11 TaxID=2482728 RepID=UPI000F5E636F|nr:TonB-dependent receptor [Pedobacter sp. G11]AZI26391.1 TonB-dependent receptor [Pedobacter sp. G11]
MKTLFLMLLCLTTGIAFAQTGTIKGRVLDKQSEKPISGATVSLVDDNNLKTTTDQDGNFRLPNIPLGRQNIQISFLGYENATVSEIEITTGKESILSIALSEKFNNLEGVRIVGTGRGKSRAINQMAAVSARQFSAEEASRYSGGRSDVARLASNFAGVATADDSRNDIVIRGNSPSGLLWRIEGIPVPSPNHFSTLGTTGSPVSALNPNMLANSDFITSAFPAEYGNAIGGIFDLGFRKGNTDTYEFTLGAAAFPGAEAMAEGPLFRKAGGSFLVAARYGIVGPLGLAGTAAQPNYNDLSFNLDFGNSKAGNFSVFGILGNSDIDFIGNEITDDKDLFAKKDEDSYAKSNFTAFGLKHTINLGAKSYLKTVLGTSSAKSTYEAFRFLNYQTPSENRIEYTNSDNTERRMTFSTFINSKMSSKITLRAGLLYENFNLKANISDRDRQPDRDGDGIADLSSLISTDGRYQIVQPFAQAQFRLTEKLTLNTGVHGQYFSVNEQFVAEPRASLSYSVSPKSTINVGYGMHHQNVPAPILFLNENVGGSLVQTNKNLKFVASQHYVVGYDLRFADNWRAKLELYHQAINNAAVERARSGYSSLTEGASFTYSIDKTSLVNDGKGSNSGVEFTLEKFFSKGYNLLLTSSFFESKYKGSDGVERNSPFNNGYVVNFLAGKEFKIGKNGRNVFSINTKFSTAGGRYYTPTDLAASRAAGFDVKDDTNPFSEQYDDYLRLDLKFGIKLNSKTKKLSHQFYVDFQNLTDRKNVFIREYNRQSGMIDQKNQIGFQPDFGYRFNF